MIEFAVIHGNRLQDWNPLYSLKNPLSLEFLLVCIFFATINLIYCRDKLGTGLRLQPNKLLNFIKVCGWDLIMGLASSPNLLTWDPTSVIYILSNLDCDGQSFF